MHKLSIYCSKYNKFQAFLSLVFLYILFSLISPDCIGQITFTVSQPRLRIFNDSLIITYDISRTKSDDKFYIWLEITDSSGVEIGAYTLKGDVGDDIKAGANKQIVWNFIADEIFIDNTINVEIIAEKMAIPEIVPEKKDVYEKASEISKNEDIADGEESKKVTEKPEITYTRVKVGKHLLQSTIFPGWGSTILSVV